MTHGIEMVTGGVDGGWVDSAVRMLADLRPLADTCAVNGALVCFMSAHAHRVGLLHAALGSHGPARNWLHHALGTHQRLGARLWEAETRRVLASLDGDGEKARPVAGSARLQRVGEMWEATFGGRTAYLRDAKGLHDLAVLLSRPGVDVPALDLAGGGVSDSSRVAPVLDRTALTAYRRRLDDRPSAPA